MASKPSSGFSYTPPKKKEKKSEWVRYQAPIALLDKVRRHLRRPSMSPSDIGRHAFDHFVKTECGTDSSPISSSLRVQYDLRPAQTGRATDDC